MFNKKKYLYKNLHLFSKPVTIVAHKITVSEEYRQMQFRSALWFIISNSMLQFIRLKYIDILCNIQYLNLGYYTLYPPLVEPEKYNRIYSSDFSVDMDKMLLWWVDSLLTGDDFYIPLRWTIPRESDYYIIQNSWICTQFSSPCETISMLGWLWFASTLAY